MTVIAWDGKTLAADKLASQSGLRCTVTKIHRVRGMLVGTAGCANLGREIIKWFAGGAKPEEFPSDQRNDNKACSVIVVNRDRRVLSYWTSPVPLELETQQHAIGSGRDFAMAAMHLGHDARRAVEVACVLSPDCGNGIDTLTLEEVTAEQAQWLLHESALGAQRTRPHNPMTEAPPEYRDPVKYAMPR